MMMMQNLFILEKNILILGDLEDKERMLNFRMLLIYI